MYLHALNRCYARHVVPTGSVLILSCFVLTLFMAGCGAFVTTTPSQTSSSGQSSGQPPAQTSGALTITQQPANQTVSPSHAATFSVTATGQSPLHYQWQKNGSPVSDATQASYTTPLATPADNGDRFEVKVTGSNGSILSHVATLTVTAPASTPAQLNATPTALNFGNVPVGSTVTRQIALATSGSSEVTLTKIGVAGPGFNVSGVSAGLSQGPGQSTVLVATFAPQSSGNATGSITISSNASDPLTTIHLSGSGIATPHFVSLAITIPTPANVVGYNVYRSTTHGGPYAKLTQSATPTATYTDMNVKAGDIYYYVATSVDADNTEGDPSDEVSAIVPIQ